MSKGYIKSRIIRSHCGPPSFQCFWNYKSLISENTARNIFYSLVTLKDKIGKSCSKAVPNAFLSVFEFFSMPYVNVAGQGWNIQSRKECHSNILVIWSSHSPYTSAGIDFLFFLKYSETFLCVTRKARTEHFSLCLPLYKTTSNSWNFLRGIQVSLISKDLYTKDLFTNKIKAYNKLVVAY